MQRIYEFTHFFSPLVTVCMCAVLCAECCIALCFEFVLKCLPYTLDVDVVGCVIIVVVFFMHTYTNATAHMYIYVQRDLRIQTVVHFFNFFYIKSLCKMIRLFFTTNLFPKWV